jgi:YD repeat-containing protein
MSIVAILILLFILHVAGGGVPDGAWRKAWNTVKALAVVVLIWMAIVAVGISFANAQTATYRDNMGRVVGRSSTDARGTTTFYNPLGQQTGRAVTNNGSTIFRDNMGRQTGTVQRSK